jgi:hypothetical protein
MATTQDTTRAKQQESPLKGKGGFSASTLRAKWVESPNERQERKGQTLATRDHETIRRWAEERGAVPATVSATKRGRRAGVLRFIFDKNADPGRLEEVDWEQWFRAFDERELVFVHQQTLRNGSQSNFFRFDSPRGGEAPS